MEETNSSVFGKFENSLQDAHKQWALWTIKKLRLINPELSVTLYQSNWAFTIHVTNCKDKDFPHLAEYFHQNIRPVTSNIGLSQQISQSDVLVQEVDDYEAEIWLNGIPLNVRDFNILMSLAEPSIPDGGVDFDHARNIWIFRSFNSITNDEKACVQKAAIQVGLLGTIDFVVENPPTTPPPIPVSVPTIQGDLTLITSRYLKHSPGTLRDLVHQDEDEWRTFLSRRARQEIVAPEMPNTSNFACLYDVEHCGESRLSELLTIYDRVDIMPQTRSSEWYSKHKIPLTDLQELVRLKRARIILPYSVSDYPSQLIEAVAEVDRSSIVLSRALAAKTIAQGQMKEPFLYAPLTSSQRAAVLSALSRSVTDEKFRGLLRSYGELFSGQHNMFMMRGALASLNFGVGAYIGDVFFKLGKNDARLELMVNGAGIEWALGLGVSYIPRDFGGFDETHNSQIIASYLGRTKINPSDPVANRMHIISDGLLAMSDVPPLEIAKNFNSTNISRFRTLAQRLMKETPSNSELQDTVVQINNDVKAFERRADRLASFKLSALCFEAGLQTLDHHMGGAASIGAAWLYEMLEDKLPAKLQSELKFASAMLAGLATGSSLDAVIVSRSRKTIAKN